MQELIKEYEFAKTMNTAEKHIIVKSRESLKNTGALKNIESLENKPLKNLGA